MKARIQFDGGCNPNPGIKYGSYAVSIDDTFEIGRSRFPLGIGTNNEAEFESLILALRDLFYSCGIASVKPEDITVDIFTDSTIVRGWIEKFHQFNPAKCKNERRLAMSKLAGQCHELLKNFKSHTIQWNSRDRNVEKFGH